ncbi:universal stress protein [Nocardia terpenica]
MSTRADRQSVAVGVDGTPPSMNAARWAGYLAHALHAPLSIVHALPVPEHRPRDTEPRSSTVDSPTRRPSWCAPVSTTSPSHRRSRTAQPIRC